jgi:fido (protein-threonine AMPylation protein)
MGYSVDFISFDCYSDTTVLIRDEEKSNEVEGVITSARYTKWLSAPEVKDFDFAYYKEIHRFLLSVKEVAGFNERF